MCEREEIDSTREGGRSEEEGERFSRSVRRREKESNQREASTDLVAVAAAMEAAIGELKLGLRGFLVQCF